MRSSFVLRGGELRCWRSCLAFLPSVVGFFCCINFIFWRLTAQLSYTMPSLAHDGSPYITGSSVSTMYHLFYRWFATFFPLESSLLLYPVFQPGVFWIHCKLSGMSWMISVLLVNHQHWYLWGTAWRMCTVAWHYHPHQCQPCTWESQVYLVQSQLASRQSQRLQLLSLSEHQITQLSQDQHCSSYVWQLVVPCEMVSAEQLRQHQLHHNGGLHQFQLHWP